jgi:hypothetical protein
MERVGDAVPMGFWDLLYPSTVGVVAGRGEIEVEVVDLGDGGCDCGVAMEEVVDYEFGCAVELHVLARGGFQGCIASL